MARLAAIKLLPSPDIPEVIRIFLCVSLIPRDKRETLIFLNSSAITVLLPGFTTNSSLTLLNEISPIIGILVRDSISDRYNILGFSNSFAAIKITGKPKANASVAK